MSLPYPRRKLSAALEVLERLDVLLGDEVVIAWQDGVALHADTNCSRHTQPLEISLAEWVTHQENDRRGLTCDCGGVAGTVEGSCLEALALSLQALEADRTRYVAKSWAETDAWFSIAATPLQNHRTPTSRLETLLSDLPERISQAALRVAERSLTALPVLELHRAVAAQGVVVPIKPSLGSYLERWARECMEHVVYDRVDPGDAFQQRGVKPSAPLFESALQDALALRESRVLAIATDALTTPKANSPQVRLALLLLRSAGIPLTRVLSCVRLPIAVADGLSALLTPLGLCVECGDEPLDDVTVELAVRLWSPSERGPLSRLDGAVGAARLLV